MSTTPHVKVLTSDSDNLEDSTPRVARRLFFSPIYGKSTNESQSLLSDYNDTDMLVHSSDEATKPSVEI